MMCRDEPSMNDLFNTMDGIHRKSFEELGGEYNLAENETTCAIRLPPNRFFEDYPPQHQRFRGKKIPSHITYAYKKDATIAQNDDFYTLPNGQTKKVDILFVIASAPLGASSLPEDGSESHVGLAITMELAINELAEKFPAFFGG